MKKVFHTKRFLRIRFYNLNLGFCNPNLGFCNLNLRSCNLNLILPNLILILILLFFTACGSNKFTVPEDANAMQLIQMGQDALSMGSYDKAAKYYNAVIQRYGMDTAIYVEACYELGHLLMKQKQYLKARGNFEEIIAIFEGAEYGSLPAAYKKLAQMGLDAIPARYKGK